MPHNRRPRFPSRNVEDKVPTGYAGPGQVAYRSSNPFKLALRKKVKRGK